MAVPSLVLLLIIYSSTYFLRFSTAVDFISSSRYLQDPETVASNGSVFRMGFFTPNGSAGRYFGVWYDGYPVFTPVWVANRESPITGSSGVVTVSEDGNLVVMDGKNKETLWSSNVTGSGRGGVVAQLFDTGNLVLLDSSSSGSNASSGGVIWQSFHHVTDSYLAKMNLSSNVNTNRSLRFTSWKSLSDPAPGPFSLGLVPLNIPEVFVWNGTRPYWRSGPWNGQIFIGIPTMLSNYLNGFTLLNDNQGTFTLTYTYAWPFIVYYVLLPNGTFLCLYWDNDRQDRAIYWSSATTECDVYGKCGPSGICNSLNSPICSCPRGFKPSNLEEWSGGNWASGCVRKISSNCGKLSVNGTATSEEDGFLRLETMKVPDSADWSTSVEDDCASNCLSNCSCVAYAYDAGVGCMTWTGDLIDLQKFHSGGVDFHIRVPKSEIGKPRNFTAIAAIVTTSVAIFTAIAAVLLWRRMRKQRASGKFQKTIFLGQEESTMFPSGSRIEDNLKLQELKLLSMKELSTATDSFSAANKLGQGGFGPVYMGKLLDGPEIAVKRLSRNSGQGLEEFMNEMLVISKVQHRNLVRLLGCCVEGDEKIIVYEFMLNGSLDAFLFDAEKRKELEWTKRFSIIDGVCRGLLYLHRDSRLRIIHRDLKASNILLDEELVPKISDFGMARIFGGKEDEANTRRVVGTYGYMAPEYAMQGLFSEKSDVFSFGVLLLEIVSGKKNASCNRDEESSSLLGLAWKLWCEGKAAALLDPVIVDSSNLVEALRCVHVGLLCTQELVKDRPTTSTIISMLNREIADLPDPKKPAFTEREMIHDTDSFEHNEGTRSSNNITITMIEGR